LLFHGQPDPAAVPHPESMGPFYCPVDHRVVPDGSGFFREMDTRFHASGDFARAYGSRTRPVITYRTCSAQLPREPLPRGSGPINGSAAVCQCA